MQGGGVHSAPVYLLIYQSVAFSFHVWGTHQLASMLPRAGPHQLPARRDFQDSWTQTPKLILGVSVTHLLRLQVASEHDVRRAGAVYR